MMNSFGSRLSGSALLLILWFGAGQALADGCNPIPFSRWLNGVRREARAVGVSEVSVRALDGLRYDPKVIEKDRDQTVLAQDFLFFTDRLVTAERLEHGRQYLLDHAGFFRRLKADFGVPAAVVTAIWALETKYGTINGDYDTLRSLATLAHDCRRPEFFRPQLISALHIIEQGHLTAAGMKGAWAGEVGQTQFLPSDYLTFGRDADGDGRIDMIGSAFDALASAAAFIAHLGWRRGEPWMDEVTVPENLPWEKANLETRLPRRTWLDWGVAGRSGKLQADDFEASLLLPMGKDGPAFLIYPNMYIFIEWNKSLVYATTVAYLATRLDGAPPVSRGRAPVDCLTVEEIRTLQRILKSIGHDVGAVDAVIGSKTRNSVRQEQKRLGLPVDGYPNRELLERLRELDPMALVETADVVPESSSTPQP